MPDRQIETPIKGIVFIDLYGRIGLVKKPKDKYGVLDEFLEYFFLEENVQNDSYREYKMGFYECIFEMDREDHDCPFLYIEEIGKRVSVKEIFEKQLV